MGLSIQCHAHMRLKIGDGIFIYCDRTTRVLIECPPDLRIEREYAALDKGAYCDPRAKIYFSTRKEAKEGADPESGGDTAQP